MKFLIAGMGITGMDVARFCIARNIPFDGFDDKKDEATLAKVLGTSDFRLFHRPADVVMGEYDQLVISPGLRQDHPVLVAARQAGLPIVAEVELAWRYVTGKVIGITGSNGKSTTTSLIHHILDHAGFSASLCGNIGVPMIARVNDDPEHVFVLELSSFQLENVTEFRPHIGLLLNISPDHLDWHGGFAGYEAAKLNLFRQQEAPDLAVVTPDYASRLPGSAQVISVPGTEARLEGDRLEVADDFVLPVSEIPLLGQHNQLNVLFACVVARQLGLDANQVAQALKSFSGLEHRMEPVGTFEGRFWINDTKATNVHACQAAVDAMQQPYVLIMGGCDKGERFSGLKLDAHPPKAIVAYGETAEKIMEDLASYHPVHVHAFKEACLRAHELAGEGTAVLLAPACASFDQFENFAFRGKVFKKIFSEMAEVP